MQRRSAGALTYRLMQPTGSYGGQPQFSGDGNWYWNGSQWVSLLSPDGRFRWTGTAWVAVRKKMLFGDHANQSIACAVIGLACGFFFPFGLWAGWKAYQELPWKRTQATVGMILNGVGMGLWVATVMYRIAVR